MSPLLLAAALAAAPYSLPFQLRPTLAADVVRMDTTVATRDDGGVTTASLLFASTRLAPGVAAYFRAASVWDSPARGNAGWALGNPVLGALWVHPLGEAFRLGAAASLALPLGAGGGESPEATRARTVRAGIPARAGLDNSLFGINGLTVTAGVDLSWQHAGFTVQAEATLIQFVRTRGVSEEPDAARTNTTAGLHVAWFAAPWLSLGGELRVQHYLGTPTVLAVDASARNILSAAVGARFHVPLGTHWLRPAVTLARPLDEPLLGRGYTWVQLDVPFIF
ncbi:MAG: hypothetical protein RL653_2938 [Pseudomonadota bacterium]|jgi:hypothetical protein